MLQIENNIEETARNASLHFDTEKDLVYTRSQLTRNEGDTKKWKRDTDRGSKIRIYLLSWSMDRRKDCLVGSCLSSTASQPLQNQASLRCPSSFQSRQCRQGCQIFLGTIFQHGEKYTKLPQNIPNYHKIYQITIKYTKLPQNIPNGRINKMSIIYTNIIHCKALQNFPKLR
jgi:hypothetical protein